MTDSYVAQDGFSSLEPLASVHLGDWMDGIYQIVWVPPQTAPNSDRVKEWLPSIGIEDDPPQFSSMLLAYHAGRVVVLILLDRSSPQLSFDPSHPGYPEIESAQIVDPLTFLHHVSANPSLDLRPDQTIALTLIWVAGQHQGKGLATQMVRLFSAWSGIPSEKLYVDRPLGSGGADFVKRAFPNGYCSHL
jgi:hypothetical protein